jgi:hypothetical protein
MRCNRNALYRLCDFGDYPHILVNVVGKINHTFREVLAAKRVILVNPDVAKGVYGLKLNSRKIVSEETQEMVFHFMVAAGFSLGATVRAQGSLELQCDSIGGSDAKIIGHIESRVRTAQPWAKRGDICRLFAGKLCAKPVQLFTLPHLAGTVLLRASLDGFLSFLEYSAVA